MKKCWITKFVISCLTTVYVYDATLISVTAGIFTLDNKEETCNYIIPSEKLTCVGLPEVSFDMITSLASVCCWKKRVRYCPAVRESVTDRSGARAYGE
jgi:hypothetical protein